MFVALVGTSVLARPTTTAFSVKAGKSKPGGNIELSVKGKSSVKNAKFTATATIHFASGDVTTELLRKGRSYEARARVRVGAGEVPGDVGVDITIVFNDQSQLLSTKAVIEGERRHDDDDGDGGGGGDDGGH
jgi:hypothetical protein